VASTSDGLKGPVGSALSFGGAFLAPSFVLFIGVIAKVAIIDPAPDPGVNKELYFRENYAKDIWLSLVIASYLSGVTWYFAGGEQREKVIWFLIGPVLIGLTCLFLVVGLPKWYSVGPAWTIWIPAGLGFVSSGVSGVLAREPRRHGAR
jgi:hypothetical protein